MIEKHPVMNTYEATAGDAPGIDEDGPGKEGRQRVLQVTGIDPAFAAKLCEILWREYHAAGCPLGISEEGMFRWLMQEAGAM